ncbi:MAG: sigma-70 family RNA polymerase sigma factor [Clostridia bacterium]|nr:sigma-70 family RNA polymerase sigma factor [Clostridia bacterium]
MEIKEYFSRVRGGDKEAFKYIYNELKTPVFTIACRIVQSREVAEDITHDVFVKLFASPPEPTVRNPRAWVFQMTRNLSIDALRAKQSVNLDDVQQPAEDALAGIITRMDVETAIGKLPCDEREILSLHLNGSLGFSQIARIVGLSLPATYRKYRKAITALREYLGGT